MVSVGCNDDTLRRAGDPEPDAQASGRPRLDGTVFDGSVPDGLPASDRGGPDAAGQVDAGPLPPDAGIVEPDGWSTSRPFGEPDLFLTLDEYIEPNRVPIAEGEPLRRFTRYFVELRDSESVPCPFRQLGFTGVTDNGYRFGFYEWMREDRVSYHTPDIPGSLGAAFCTIDDDGFTITMHWWGDTTRFGVSRHFVVLPADAPE